MIASSGSRKFSTRRGVAAAEFALVAPVLFLLLFGIIQYGQMLMVQEMIVNAAREGARAAIIPGETDAQVATVVGNYMTAAGLSPPISTGGVPTTYTATLSPTLASSPASGTALTMTVSVPFSTVSWVAGSTFFQGQTLSSSVVMIKE